MITFLVGLLILLVGYITYSRYVEKQFSPDDRPTPAYAINDGVDFVPLSTKRNQMIQLLSIAGMGPILGVIQGILFGPITFILIPLGCILMGAVHDYSAGMISMRNKGMQVTGLIEKYLGKNWYYISLVVIAFMMLLVAVVFVYTSGDLIASKFFNVSDFSLSNKTIVLIYGIIIAYYLLSTMFSIDKIIGNVYPILGLILIIGTLLLVVGFFVKGVNLQEINFSQLNTHPNKLYLIPMFFMTISCGLLSGFHSTQSTVIARTVKHEKEGRKIFYAMMCVESFIAMVWGAAAMTVYNLNIVPEKFIGQVPAVQIITEYFVPSYLAFIVIIAIVVLPITTGDTSLRALRLTLSDAFKVNQSKAAGRFLISIPVFCTVIFSLYLVKTQPDGFTMIWRYFMFVNQLVVLPTLFFATIYLYRNKKNYFITLLPGMLFVYIDMLFILNAKIGFNLSYNLSSVIALILVGASVFWLSRKLKNNKD